MLRRSKQREQFHNLTWLDNTEVVRAETWTVWRKTNGGRWRLHSPMILSALTSSTPSLHLRFTSPPSWSAVVTSPLRVMTWHTCIHGARRPINCHVTTIKAHVASTGQTAASNSGLCVMIWTSIVWYSTEVLSLRLRVKVKRLIYKFKLRFPSLALLMDRTSDGP